MFKSELFLHVQFEECYEVRFVVFGEETKFCILSSYKTINWKDSVIVAKLYNLLYYREILVVNNDAPPVEHSQMAVLNGINIL